MNLPLLLAVLLGLAVALAWTRLGFWQRRAPIAARSRGWRLATLWLLQPVCALLLYFTLLPPTLPTEAGTLVVATAGATRTGTQATGDRLIALPEAPALANAERVPDLATALRRYPGMQRLRIVGTGLESRDREAASGMPLAFDAPALPRGVVRLDGPRRVAPGAAFRVGGKVNGVAGGTVELIDPAGRRVDATALSAKGDFLLAGTARASGAATFTVRARDSKRKPIEDVLVPVWTSADPPPRVLLLAGAPSPELKYLRRWATDAGLALHTQLNVGGGLNLGDAPLRLDASTFSHFDLVVLDERSWATLGAGQRAALMQAVREGLGLLLRATSPLPDATRRQWQALGFALSPGADTTGAPLPAPAIDEEALRARRGPGTADTPPAPNGNSDEGTALTRRALALGGIDATPLLRDADGKVLAIWRAEQRGRIALWSVTDSFALVLSGEGTRHAELWSEAFATLARAQSAAAPDIDAQPREQQRMALCGLGDKPRVASPNGQSTVLLLDPTTGTSRCAGYWPQRSGWHLLQQTDREAGEQTWPFFVNAADAAPGLRAAELRDATLRLVDAPQPTDDKPSKPTGAPRLAPSWPWFLAWLASAGVLWWLERARFGRAGKQQV